MNKNDKVIIVAVVAITVLALVATVFILKGKKKKEKSEGLKLKAQEQEVEPKKSIIIGDSQTPLIARQSKKIIKLGDKEGEENLWKGGMGLGWLKNSVSKYPKDNEVRNVVINIGTNGGFNTSDDINGLFVNLKNTFPKAEFYAVQGSWGWGNNKNKTEQQVRDYYKVFKKNGAKIIEPPIGNVKNPHGNLPVYAEIGKAIDNII
jgi:hypothetical protein